MSHIKIAGVQMDIKLAAPDTNLTVMHKHLQTTTAAGAKLTIFPECTTTGYCFETFEEAFEVSEPCDGSSVTEMIGICEELNKYAIFGFLERDGEQIFNSVVCVGPNGIVAKYRKVHLPTLGVDNFTTPGDNAFEVFDLKLEGQAESLLGAGRGRHSEHPGSGKQRLFRRNQQNRNRARIRLHRKEQDLRSAGTRA